METLEEIRDVSVCALYVAEAPERCTIRMDCAILSYIQGVVHPCLITDSRCRWLKAGALWKKEKRKRRKREKKIKKEQAPGPSVVAGWGSTHYD